MNIERDSIHFRILERICALPRPVRGISGAMLDRDFEAPWAVQELAAAGLIRERGWHDGPGSIWIPTARGEDLFRELLNGVSSQTASPRWLKKADPKTSDA